jgi:hypothetical protein
MSCVLPLYERLHVSRRDQLHFVAELGDRTAPVMGAGAGLHGDAAGRLSGEEGQDLVAPKLLAEHWCAGGIRPVGVEDVLGQVQADGANLCHGRLPPVVLNTTTLARRCRRGGVHPITGGR